MRLTEILETFPRVFCFRKSRINENGVILSTIVYKISFTVYGSKVPGSELPHFFSEEIGSRIGQNKTQATACRLSLKCRLGPELSHRLIRNIFSIHDPILATKK